VSPPTPVEGTQEQPRKRGEALLCKECGAINEPQAWYCEICGSEL
jgi:ribosomal protein L40E